MALYALTNILTKQCAKLPKCMPVFFLAALCVPVTFFSCTSIGSDSRPTEGNLFRSEDYVIYELPDAATAADLAERFLGNRKKAWVIEEANPGISFTGGKPIVIPLNDRNKGGLSADGFQTIPVLNYHRFDENCDAPLCMPIRIFERQMRYLKEHGYHVITPEELLAFLDYRQGLPRKSLWITIDDGYRSAYEIAYPILKKYGFVATLFIYTNFVGASKMAITWDQLREIRANGFTIGSHTIYHSDLTKPKEEETEPEYVARIKEELHGSKKIIDRKLKQDTYLLAYPFGLFDQRSIKIAREAGYKIAVSVKRGGNPFFANPLSLRRDQVLERDMQVFISTLKTFSPMSLK